LKSYVKIFYKLFLNFEIPMRLSWGGGTKDRTTSPGKGQGRTTSPGGNILTLSDEQRAIHPLNEKKNKKKLEQLGS
jgi:hypothetical protein